MNLKYKHLMDVYGIHNVILFKYIEYIIVYDNQINYISHLNIYYNLYAIQYFIYKWASKYVYKVINHNNIPQTMFK
jgi:hypothetical protein